MALQKFKCLDCEKEFKVGDYVCVTGVNHKVVSKRYYMSDAPTIADASGNVNKRDSATLILNIPPEKRTTGPDGNERVLPGGSAQFIRGMYETSDPEQQYWLDQHKGMCTKKEWEAAYLNDREKMELDRMNFAAERQRFESERNELLAQVQKR